MITFGLSGLAAAYLFAGLAKAPVSQPYMAKTGSGHLKDTGKGSPPLPVMQLCMNCYTSEFSSSFLSRSWLLNFVNMGAQQQQAKLTGETVNPRLLEAQYAVRGDIVARSAEIKSDLKAGKGNYPFKSVVNCNIGNPHVRRGHWLRPSVVAPCCTLFAMHSSKQRLGKYLPGAVGMTSITYPYPEASQSG